MDIVTLAAARKYADTKFLGFVPKGAYNPANENKYGEWYTHEGGSYGYIYPTPSTGVPVTDTTHWQQIASIGGQDLVDAAVAARDAAQGYKDAAAASAAQLAAGLLRPKGTYADLDALNAGTPTVADTDEIYITLADSKWCYHNGAAWVAGGQFQAASVVGDIASINSQLAEIGNYLGSNLAYEAASIIVTGAGQYVSQDIVVPDITPGNTYALKIDSITGATNTLPVVVYVLDESGATLSTLYTPANTYSNLSLSIPTTSLARSIKIRLYPSIAGGLSTEGAVYSGIKLIDGATVIRHIDSTVVLAEESVVAALGDGAIQSRKTDMVSDNAVYSADDIAVSGAGKFVTKVIEIPVVHKNTYYTVAIDSVTGSTATLPLLLQAKDASDVDTTTDVYSKSNVYTNVIASIFANDNTEKIWVTLYGATNYLAGTAHFIGVRAYTGVPQDGPVKLLSGVTADSITGNAQARWKPSITIPSYSHRGYQYTAPVCTGAAIIEARRRGYEGCENDVNITSDGEFVMWHDSTLGRLGTYLRDISGYWLYLDGSGNPYWYDEPNTTLYTYADGEYTESAVSLATLTKARSNTFSTSTLTLAVLKRLDFGRWKSELYAGQQILTFAEWVLLCHRLGLKIIVDTKVQYTDEQATTLINIVKNAGMLAHTTWNVDGLYSDALRAVDPKARLQWLGDPTVERCDILAPWLESGGPGSVALCPQSTAITAENAARAHVYGIDLSCWLVDYAENNYAAGFVESEIARVADLGITSMVLDQLRVIDVFNDLYGIGD